MDVEKSLMETGKEISILERAHRQEIKKIKWGKSKCAVVREEEPWGMFKTWGPARSEAKKSQKDQVKKLLLALSPIFILCPASGLLPAKGKFHTVDDGQWRSPSGIGNILKIYLLSISLLCTFT